MSAPWKRWTWRALVLIVATLFIVAAIFETGLADKWMRGAIVRQLEQGTGARVEMGGFHFQLWSLRAEIDNLTLHGLEPAGQPPLFHADRIDVAIRVLSFIGRQVALDELIVERPQVAVRVDQSGLSNLPTPRVRAGSRPWRETVFQLRVGRLELRDGSIAYNGQQGPLAVDGRNFNFSLHYDAPVGGADSYAGNLVWQQVRLSAGRNVPFPFDVSLKFRLRRDSFEADELVLKALHSELDLSAELPSFTRSEWNLKYRGTLSLEDIRKVFRAPTTPDGIADFSGQAHYVSGAANEGEWTASGYYRGHDIRMPYKWFHARGLETWGDYEVANRRLVVPNLKVRALGGTVDGRLAMDFKGLAFRTETRLRGVSLAAVFAALENDDFPVLSLHWNAAVDLDAVNTWNANFQHFRTAGHMQWSSPAALAPGTIPVTARVDYDYGVDRQVISTSNGQIATPKASIDFDGPLGAPDSALEVNFRADDLADWNDFINAVRGDEAEPQRVAGRATWRGRILGPITGPTFVGHLNAADAQYGQLHWEAVNGDIEYSPDVFRMNRTSVTRGKSAVTLDLSLQFDGDWNFLSSSPWSLEARVERASTDDVQAIFGTSYPITGNLSGDVRGGGTRAAPLMDANFVLEEIVSEGWHFDRLTGQLHWQHDDIRLTHAELRGGTGLFAGDVSYRPEEQQVEFNLTGTGIALEKIRSLQAGSLPVAGQLSISLHGSGPLRAPIARGDLLVVGLKLGTEAEGDFSGQLASDGKSAHVTLASEPAHEKLQGDLTIGFAGDEPISGRLAVTQFDLDSFIVAALHLKQLTGHSSADGVFTISGALRRPDTIEVDADIARIAFNYDLVQLTNDQDIRATYRRNEIRIEQARLHGTDTDLRISGSARFDRDRRIAFDIAGGVNLRLLKSVVPDVDAQGRAEMNVSITGTMAQPRVTGRATVRDASAHYAEFPVGLSKVNGDFVFDASRLLFDRITAEAGGGQLTLSGSVTYGEGPPRYEVTATTSVVRIRYPAGMSWLASGTLQMSGTSQAALVSGRVQVERLLFAQGVDVASFFASASETSSGPASTSPFLQNLAFDVEGQTTPGARIEWAGAHVEVEGNVRLRGTWDRPILLGDLHLLGGEMPFRGNVFDLTRGEINFSNPFRLDPVLNVEATSTINQYQVTIDFSGPASHLALNYRSDPPLPDSDIVALLALGNTGQGTGLRSQPGGAQNYGATALLSEAISSGIGGRIEHLFGISSFRVDPFVAGTATESNAAARVTVQERITRDLTITYSTNAATSNQYQLIQVEYTVKRGLSVVFLRDINGTYGLDVKFVKHFK
ncbi:MAG TPA: translocation/assembly module TamB domain-containing protein [Candidatus Acidoferrales bacterium]|nr:translocation/assembly module TamB domain-containing protein [Candidatus Acidoferrales bacterium]